MEIDVIQHQGSVEDMISSLRHMNPQSTADQKWLLEFLRNSLDYEVKNKNRTSVIRMLYGKIDRVKKYKEK
jgi:hypothetical protein